MQIHETVLVNNHPSGELQPSTADKDITDRLIQAGPIVETLVYDHLIITETSYFSFKESRLMSILEKSERYLPNYKLVQRIKAKARRRWANVRPGKLLEV